MPSAWPASSSSTCSKFGSLITPTPIRTASGDRDQLGRLHPALLLVAADDQPAREHDRRGEPGPLHAGHRPRVGSRSRASASGSSLMPNTVGPEPVTIGCSTPASRSASSAGSIAGQSLRAAASRSLTGVEVAGADGRRRRFELLRRARRVAGVELAVDLAGAELRVERDDDQRRLVAGRAARRARRRRSSARGAPCSITVTSAPSRIGRSGGIGRPEACETSRSAAAASLDPPAMPAAIGMRLVISIRSGGPSQPGRGAELGERASGQVLAVDPGTDDFVKPKGPGPFKFELVREVDGLDDRDQRVQAVGARRADEQAQVHLARALTQALPQRAPVGGRERFGAGVGGMAERDQRLARAVADVAVRPGRQRERARERLAAVGEAVLDERAQGSRAVPGRGGAGRRARSRRSAPGGTRCAGSCAPRGRRTRAGPAPTARRRPTWTARPRTARRPPSAPSPPTCPRSRARSCAGSRSRRPRRAGWRRPCSARGRAHRGRA